MLFKRLKPSIEEIIPFVKDSIALGKDVRITVTGNSMSPFLRHLCWSSRLLKKSLSRRLLL